MKKKLHFSKTEIRSDRWSYWDRSILLRKSDILIAGSGIVGLSAALSVKETHPKLQVMVIERGPLPHGASTRNAGFACIGSVTELQDDLRKHSEQSVFDLVKMRKEGLDLLMKRLGKKNLGYERKGGFEIFTDQETLDSAFASLEYFNKNLSDITGLKNTFDPCTGKQNKQFGLNLRLPMICNQFEGQINTGRMMDTLIQECLKRGVRILNSTEITGFQESERGVEVMTVPFGPLHGEAFLICTNGFAEELIRGSGVKPARAQVLITDPVPNLCLNGSFHYDRGYVYFRDVDGRVLLGGARNLDFQGEETSSMEVSELLQDHLENLLHEMILPGKKIHIAQRWAGIMGVGEEKRPITKMIGKRTACSVRMGGMGIALGSTAGREGARLILEAL